jgi:hypothetical protein
MSTAKVKSAKPAPASERLRELYRPGVLEHGLKIIAKAQDDADAKKEATTPEVTSRDEYLRLHAAKIVADARLEVATEQRKAEKDKAAADAEKAEEDKRSQASRAFASAFHGWLMANAGLEDPDITEEAQPELWRTQSEVERLLFATPSVYPDQIRQKLEAFEAILSNELTCGPRRDSLLMLALGSIKQDCANLEIFEALR